MRRARKVTPKETKGKSSSSSRFELPVIISDFATIPCGDYGNLKPGIQIEILSTGDPEEEAAQIEQAMRTAEMAYRRIDEVLLVLVSEALADVPSLKGVIEAQQKALEVIKENMYRMANEVKRQQTLLREAGLDKKAGD